MSIEDAAHFAANEMYDINNYIKLVDVIKIYNWCHTAKRCIEIDPLNDPELYSEEHDILVRKMYVQYGYAVEEFVNINIQAGKLPPPRGYDITIQETHGSTRPDFVIRQDTPSGKKTVAWLDLTSQNSLDHINKKIGAGWKNTPFVAELSYPPLILSNIAISGDYSIAQRAALNSAIRQQEMRQRLLNEYMVKCTDKALGTMYSELIRPRNNVNIHYIALVFEQAFRYSLMHKSNHQQVVKGILVEYVTGYNSYISTARYIIFNYYSDIHSRKSDAMRYVRDSYANSNPYIYGSDLDSYF